MKRFFVIIIPFLLVTISLEAQTQQGYVKTKGRMVNGQHVAGSGLPGTTVHIQGGNSVGVKSANGSFSFVVPGKTYMVESVQKKGYELVDADAVRKPYQHSANPLYLVMETPEQQQKDLLAVERKIRRNLQQQLQQREDEIELLNSSQQKKDSLLRILYQQQGDNEKLITDMAKRYSTLDYDQLDEFYRQVSWFIENGELTRADSMIRTRGDINAQVRDILKNNEAIHQQEVQLQQAKAVHQTDIDEAARRCYSYCEISWNNHQRDSAVYYLELRAQLDSTNIEWWYEAGFFNMLLANYSKAICCYKQALWQLSLQYGDNSENVAECLLRIGNVYLEQTDYTMALQYYDNALTTQKDIYGENNSVVAKSYNNIGILYYYQRDYPKAQEYYSKALSIQNRILDIDSSEIAMSFNNLGTLYGHQGDYVKADEYLNKALEIYEKYPESNRVTIATCYNNLATFFKESGNYSKSLDSFTKSLKLYLSVYGSNHPNMAIPYNNFGNVLDYLGENTKALEFYTRAMEIWKEYRIETLDVASCYINVGQLYEKQANFSKSLEYYEKALEIRKKVYGLNHPDVATSYCLLGNICNEEGDSSKALDYFSKVLDIHEQVNGIDDKLIVTAYLQIGMIHVQERNYLCGLEYMSKGISIFESIYGAEHDDTKKLKDDYDFLKKNLEFHVYTATIIDNDSPASQQGLVGEYIVLEFEDWNLTSTKSLLDILPEYQGKPKTILIMKEGKITKHTFENSIGAQIKSKIISFEDIQHIHAAYDKWKEQNKCRATAIQILRRY